MSIPPRSQVPVGLLIALGVLLLLLLGCLLGAGLSIHQVWRSAQFIEVEGEIIDEQNSRAAIQTHWTQARKERERRNNKTVYFTVIYRYRYQGSEYENNRIQPGTFGMISGANKKAFGERFKVGMKVPVFVDPDDPQNAVLLREWSLVSTMLLALSGFFGLAAMLLNYLRKHWNTPQISAR